MLYADDTVVFGTDEKEFQNNLDMFYEYSELWHLSINFDKTKIMIFGTRQDQRFNINLGGHKIDICTVLSLKILVLFLAEIGTSTKQRSIMLSKLGKQCMFFLNGFAI